MPIMQICRNSKSLNTLCYLITEQGIYRNLISNDNKLNATVGLSVSDKMREHRTS